MSFIIECIQLALIVGIGVAFFNMSTMAEKSMKHENTHNDITKIIQHMSDQVQKIKKRVESTQERFDNLDARLEVIDPGGGE